MTLRALVRRVPIAAGSVPLVLDEAVQEGRIKPNDLIVLSGFGSGLAWGTALMRW